MSDSPRRGPVRLVICSAQVPFSRGGNEVLVDTLHDQLRARGYAVDVVRLPFSWSPRQQLLQSCLAWRLLDLRTAEGQPVDRVIATRFPSYLIRHPAKVVWLVHQFRQAYDLRGTHYSDVGGAVDDEDLVARIHAMDGRGLGEAQAVHAISQNVAGRLRRHNGLEAGVLYPPPPHGDAYRQEGYGDYVLSVGRLDPLKRVDLLLRSLAATRESSGARAVIAGEGAAGPELRALASKLGLDGRVEWLGRVSDERLLDLYAGARAVYYGPYDEDYGYVTVEAFKCARPVLSWEDAGGVLELVDHGVNGYACAAGKVKAMARCLNDLFAGDELPRRLGEAGRERVRGIGWPAVIEGLTAGLPVPGAEREGA